MDEEEYSQLHQNAFHMLNGFIRWNGETIAELLRSKKRISPMLLESLARCFDGSGPNNYKLKLVGTGKGLTISEKAELHRKYMEIDAGQKILDTMQWGVPLTMKGKRPGTTVTKRITNVRNLSSPFWRSRGWRLSLLERTLALCPLYPESGH